MKKVVPFIIALIILCSVGIVSAEGPVMSGFLDVNWGADAETVISTMNAKGILFHERKIIDGIEIVSGKGTYGGETAYIAFKLYQGKMYEGMVLMIDIPEHKIINQWSDFKNLLSEKYGKPSDDFFYFKRPYYNGDGFETQAIRVGKGIADTFWSGSDGNGGNVILECEITDDLDLRVDYQHVEMAKEAVAAVKKVRAKDL